MKVLWWSGVPGFLRAGTPVRFAFRYDAAAPAKSLCVLDLQDGVGKVAGVAMYDTWVGGLSRSVTVVDAEAVVVKLKAMALKKRR